MTHACLVNVHQGLLQAQLCVARGSALLSAGCLVCQQRPDTCITYNAKRLRRRQRIYV
jgi:hypothetical protein